MNDILDLSNTEEQRTQATKLHTVDDEAIFGKSAIAKMNDILCFMISIRLAPCTIRHEEIRANPVYSERFCELQSFFNLDQAALEIAHSFLERFLDSRSRTLHARYTQERLSEERSTKELTYTALGHGNSNSDTNDLHARSPYFGSDSPSSHSRSSYQRAFTHYSESSDPTLSEAAEWHELMES